MSTKLKVVLGIIFSVIILVVMVSLSVDTIPPRSLTATRMSVTKRRVIEYARIQDHLPINLSVLPSIPGYDAQIEDAWGRTLHYKIDADGNVVLASYGRDGKPGGEGDDRDMIGVFAPKDSNGKWSDKSARWLRDPFFKK